tara:strand:+ start:1699 stop:3291 length:1593 start_codon:yes stop_codon:yes gene_type:complete
MTKQTVPGMEKFKKKAQRKAWEGAKAYSEGKEAPKGWTKPEYTEEEKKSLSNKKGELDPKKEKDYWTKKGQDAHYEMKAQDAGYANKEELAQKTKELGEGLTKEGLQSGRAGFAPKSSQDVATMLSGLKYDQKGKEDFTATGAQASIADKDKIKTGQVGAQTTAKGQTIAETAGPQAATTAAVEGPQAAEVKEVAGPQAATISEDQTIKNKQLALIENLEEGPEKTAAQMELSRQQDRQVAQQMAMSQSRGQDVSIGQRALAEQVGQIGAQAGEQQAMLTAQEDAAKRQQLGEVLGQARGVEAGLATTQAGLEQEAGLAGAGMEQQREMASAGFRQESGMAQAAMAQQKALADSTMQQESAMQASAQASQRATRNAELAQQAEMAGDMIQADKYRQQADLDQQASIESSKQAERLATRNAELKQEVSLANQKAEMEASKMDQAERQFAYQGDANKRAILADIYAKENAQAVDNQAKHDRLVIETRANKAANKQKAYDPTGDILTGVATIGAAYVTGGASVAAAAAANKAK